jgi:hypothetical protein
MSDLNSILPSIEVRPFPKTYKSRFNGEKRAPLNCPACNAAGDLYETKQNRFDLNYCRGNMPAEITHSSILGVSETHQVNCAGISHAHFHVSCGVCGFRFFLTLPEGNTHG